MFFYHQADVFAFFVYGLTIIVVDGITTLITVAPEVCH